MNATLFVLTLFFFAGCATPPTNTLLPGEIRPDVLYLEDSPRGHKRAERLKQKYGFSQQVIFSNLNPMHYTPPKRLTRVSPAYPEQLKLAGVHGYVTIVAIIDEQGRVSEAAIHYTTNRFMSSAALSAFKQWTFSPALYHGVPIRSKVEIDIVFEPEREFPIVLPASANQGYGPN